MCSSISVWLSPSVSGGSPSAVTAVKKIQSYIPQLPEFHLLGGEAAHPKRLTVSLHHGDCIQICSITIIPLLVASLISEELTSTIPSLEACCSLISKVQWATPSKKSQGTSCCAISKFAPSPFLVQQDQKHFNISYTSTWSNLFVFTINMSWFCDTRSFWTSASYMCHKQPHVLKSGVNHVDTLIGCWQWTVEPCVGWKNVSGILSL